MIYLSLSRGELEEKIEEEMLGVAVGIIPDSPGENDLQQAFDFDAVWFGGIFPTLCIDLMESRGSGKMQDRPDRPSIVEVEVIIYEPCMPVYGANSQEDDQNSRAKRITRAVRQAYLDALFKHPTLAPAIEVMFSRGAPANAYGTARVDERRESILWADRTRLEIST